MAKAQTRLTPGTYRLRDDLEPLRKDKLDYRRFTRPSPASVTEAGRACLHPAESTP